jgi:hypothetical protein
MSPTGKIVRFGISVSLPLFTILLYLQTPALTQEASQMYDKDGAGKRKGVAFEMGDLYENENNFMGTEELNVKRELRMLGNDP